MIPDLSKLTRPRTKVDLGQRSEMPKEIKYGKAPAKTIHDLKKNHEDKQHNELVIETDLSKKTTNELLDEIKEQQIELIKRGLYPK